MIKKLQMNRRKENHHLFIKSWNKTKCISQFKLQKQIRLFQIKMISNVQMHKGEEEFNVLKQNKKSFMRRKKKWLMIESA